MLDVLMGVAVLVATAAIFLKFKPRNGKRHQIVETVWGTYIGIAITGGIAVGGAMVIAGIVGLFA